MVPHTEEQTGGLTPKRPTHKHQQHITYSHRDRKSQGEESKLHFPPRHRPPSREAQLSEQNELTSCKGSSPNGVDEFLALTSLTDTKWGPQLWTFLSSKQPPALGWPGACQGESFLVPRSKMNSGSCWELGKGPPLPGINLPWARISWLARLLCYVTTVN